MRNTIKTHRKWKLIIWDETRTKTEDCAAFNYLLAREDVHIIRSIDPIKSE
jgi:hypothetical protein